VRSKIVLNVVFVIIAAMRASESEPAGIRSRFG